MRAQSQKMTEQRKRALTTIGERAANVRANTIEEESDDDIDEDGIVESEDEDTKVEESKDGPLGFPKRIRKPRGPRPEPKSWTWSEPLRT